MHDANDLADALLPFNAEIAESSDRIPNVADRVSCGSCEGRRGALVPVARVASGDDMIQLGDQALDLLGVLDPPLHEEIPDPIGRTRDVVSVGVHVAYRSKQERLDDR